MSFMQFVHSRDDGSLDQFVTWILGFYRKAFNIFANIMSNLIVRSQTLGFHPLIGYIKINIAVH